MDIFERNYKAVVNRGLITDATTDIDFHAKLSEEIEEVSEAIINDDAKAIDEEIADCLVVCSNWLIFRGVPLPYILAKIAEKNEKRALK